jgi:hypothetical protein
MTMHNLLRMMVTDLEFQVLIANSLRLFDTLSGINVGALLRLNHIPFSFLKLS